MTAATPSRPARVVRGLAALLTLLLVTAGVPIVLIAFGVYPHGLPSLHDAWHSLTTQDTTGQYFQIAAGAAVWIAWAVYTVLTLKEAAAAIGRRGRPRSVPTVGVRRLGPAALVTAVLVMFLAAPGLRSTPADAATPPGPAATRMAATVPSAWAPPSRSSNAPVEQPTDASERPTATAAASPVAARSYTVQRYDTLWGVAAQHLPGDPAQRWHDLKRLNPHAVGPDNTIQPGAVLIMPADAYGLPDDDTATRAVGGPGTHVESVPVAEGDTLSGISAAHGNPDWHTVWPLNAGRPEPGGERLIDPNHIEPGWTVAEPIPGPAMATPAPPSAQHAGTAPRTTHLPPPIAAAPRPDTPAPHEGQPPAASPAAPSVAPPSAQPTSTSSPARATSATSEQDEAAPVRDAVYAGGGVLLAAGILSALVAHRRRQFRNRRPGRMISAPQDELVPTEKALLRYGAGGAADIAFLDLALRALSAATADNPDGQLPEIAAARLIGTQFELRLAEPHPIAPPAPWVVDDSGYWWSVSIDDALPVTEDTADQVLAPYPTVVAVGQEPDGGTWLLDLEATGALALTGDPGRCLDLGRFLAAELAVNTWSDQLTVTLVGFGAELVPLNPQRIRYLEDLPTAAAALTEHLNATSRAADTIDVDILTGRMRTIAADMWMPHVLIVGPDAARHDPTGDLLDRLLRDLADRPGRSAAAVVLAGDQPATVHAQHVVTLDAAGTLTLPGLGVTLTAQQLPADRAADLSRLIELAGDLQDVPIPPSTGGAPLDEFIDAAGALLPDVVDARQTADGVEPPTAAESVLPGDDDAYLDAGAATAEELQALAPRVSVERAAQILAADPTLDADLADWLDPACARPKLQLLGPLLLTACGARPPGRIAYYTGLGAYVGTRDHGATAEQVAATFDLSKASTYSRIHVLRDWLGIDPDTGIGYLPDGTQSAGAKARGVGVYEFHGVLIDGDLFTRLRARAQLGGPDALRYLQAALDLVVGPPFDQPHDGEYTWLRDDRLDDLLTSSICDVAHTAYLAHVRAGDLAAADAAAKTGLRASPYSDTLKADVAEVMRQRGLDTEADQYLHDDLYNATTRRGDAPDDLPPRTQQVLRRRARLTRAS